EENADVVQVFDLKSHTKSGLNQVQIQVQGETALMYQIVGRYFAPWQKQPAPTVKSGFEVSVAYDRTKLATNDLLHVKATLKYHGALPANMVMLDLGIAPGFVVDPGDFAEMVGKKQVNKFSVTARQVMLYLSDLRPGDVKTFEYTLRAKYPVRAQTPPTGAWGHSRPDNRGVARPVELTVTDKK